MKLSIIIPVYNEATTLQEVVTRVVTASVGDWEKEVLIVDDGSTDGTRDLLGALRAEYPLQVLLHETNQGKGAAVRTGLSSVTGDVVLIQDADLEYHPSEYEHLLRALTPEVGAVFGSRMLHGVQGGYSHYVLGAKLLNWVTNVLFHSHLTDVYTCYKLIRKEYIKEITFTATGFEIEAELTAYLLKQRAQIKEVSITYKPRTFAQGKKIRALDALKGIYTIFRIRVTS